MSNMKPQTNHDESDDNEASFRIEARDLLMSAQDAGIKGFDEFIAFSRRTIGEQKTRRLGAYIRLVAGSVEMESVRQAIDVLNEISGRRNQNNCDRDIRRVKNDAIVEFIPNFDPDEWNEHLVDVLRRIAEAVNELQERSASRNARRFTPFYLGLDRECWDSFDEGLVELLREIGLSIEQLRLAMDSGSPLQSAEFVFDIDDSIYEDEIVHFVRRVQVVLNSLRFEQSRRSNGLQQLLLDFAETPAPKLHQGKDESTWRNLFVSARDSGDHETAGKIGKQAVREHPRSDWLWRELGGVLVKLGRLDDAEDALETAHHLNPNASWLWRHLAALHRKRNNLDDEIECFETLIRLKAAEYSDLISLGFAYHKHRDSAKAIHFFRRAAATRRGKTPWIILALLYSRSEIPQDADAADACRNALVIDPDDDKAKELLKRIKLNHVPLAAQALSAASGLLKSDDYFDFYISPFDLLQFTNMSVAKGLEEKAIQLAKKRLLHELELNDGKVSWLGNYAIDKARAIAIVDELDDEVKRRCHIAVYQNDLLLNFLTRGDIHHFLYLDDYFPCDTEEMLHRDFGFRKFLSKTFAKQYNRVLTRAIEERRLPVIEALFDGRRWVEPEDDDQCFSGAYKRLGDVVEKMRALLEDSPSRRIRLREIEDFLQKNKLPELFNLLPVHFASYQSEIVGEIRSFAISCFNTQDDPVLSRDVLSLCKRFALSNVALSNRLQEDFKTIDAVVSVERANKTTQRVHAKHNQSSISLDKLVVWGCLLVSVLLCSGILGVFESSSSTKTVPSSRSRAPSVSSTDPVRGPSVLPPKLPPAVPLPANGTVKLYGFSEGIAPLTIATRSGGGHYFVKLRTVGTRELVAEVFVREGQQASIKVPLGTYELTYATGRTWYGRKGDFFGPETRYAKADDTFTFRVDGNQILGYTIELYLQSYGNLETESMSAREF